MTEPAVGLVWFVVGGLMFAVLAGGGFAELVKKTMLARLREKARACARADCLRSKKPWWWVALLGSIATVVGAGAMALAASPLGYSPSLGLLVGAGGGVNATWLWNPVQKALKGVVGAIKGKFA